MKFLLFVLVVSSVSSFRRIGGQDGIRPMPIGDGAQIGQVGKPPGGFENPFAEVGREIADIIRGNVTDEARKEFVEIVSNTTQTKGELETEINAWAEKNGLNETLTEIVQKVTDAITKEVTEITQEFAAIGPKLEQLKTIKENKDLTPAEDLDQSQPIIDAIRQTLLRALRALGPRRPRPHHGGNPFEVSEVTIEIQGGDNGFPGFPNKNGGFQSGGFQPQVGGFQPQNGKFQPQNGQFQQQNGGFPSQNGGFHQGPVGHQGDFDRRPF